MNTEEKYGLLLSILGINGIFAGTIGYNISNEISPLIGMLISIVALIIGMIKFYNSNDKLSSRKCPQCGEIGSLTTSKKGSFRLCENPDCRVYYYNNIA